MFKPNEITITLVIVAMQCGHLKKGSPGCGQKSLHSDLRQMLWSLEVTSTRLKKLTGQAGMPHPSGIPFVFNHNPVFITIVINHLHLRSLSNKSLESECTVLRLYFKFLLFSLKIIPESRSKDLLQAKLTNMTWKGTGCLLRCSL